MTPLMAYRFLVRRDVPARGLELACVSDDCCAHARAKAQATRTSGGAFVDVRVAGREDTTDLATVPIVLPLLAVVFIQMWRNRPR